MEAKERAQSQHRRAGPTTNISAPLKADVEKAVMADTFANEKACTCTHMHLADDATKEQKRPRSKATKEQKGRALKLVRASVHLE